MAVKKAKKESSWISRDRNILTVWLAGLGPIEKGQQDGSNKFRPVKRRREAEKEAVSAD